MTAAALTPSIEYIENGVTAAFAVPFRFVAGTHIAAKRITADGTVTVLNYGSDYSVTGGGTDAGGTLTVTTPAVAGTRLNIRRVTPRAQELDYTTNDNFPAESHELGLDKAMLIDQEQDTKIDDTANRALMVPDGETISALPKRTSRAGAFLAFDGAGNPVPASGTGNDSALRADLASSLAGTLLIVWKAAGIGAVARTLWAKLNDLPVSVEDFGAVGDNVALDAAAIQLALSSPMKRIVIPPKTYYVESALVASGKLIEAYGATFRVGHSGKALTLGSGSTVKGLKLQGPDGTTFNGTSYGIVCAGTRGANGAVAPTFAQDFVIEDVVVTGFGYAGIWAEYVKNWRVRSNTILTNGYAGIAGVSVDGFEITHNLIDGVNGAGAPDTYGSFVDRFEDTVVRDPKSRRGRISGNTIRNVPNWEAIDTHGGEDITISDNIIENCRFGIAVVGSDVLGPTVLAAKNIHITNNKIKGSADGAAIIVAGAMTGSVVNDYAENIVVTGNIIFEGGRTNDAIEGAIRCYATKRLHVKDNTITQPWVRGIHLQNDNLDFDVTGNTITDPKCTTNTATACLAIAGNNNKGVPSPNNYVCENAGVAAQVARFSILITGSLSGLDIRFGAGSRWSGLAANRLSYSEGTSTGVDTTDLCTQKKTVTVSLVSGQTNNFIDFTFDKRFPAPIRSITADISGGVAPAGKFIHLTNINRDDLGARLLAYSSDGAAFTSNANLPVDVVARV